MFPRDISDELEKYYGDPDVGDDGLADAKFEATNLVEIVPPYPMIWTWNNKPVRVMKVHKLVAPSLMRILTAIGKLPRNFIEKYHLHKCGGAYTFRPKRGLSKLSLHAYGAAIDIADDLNPLGKKYQAKLGMMPKEVIDIFEKEGWTWGGLWKRPDCMHFQATRRLK